MDKVWSRIWDLSNPYIIVQKSVPYEIFVLLTEKLINKFKLTIMKTLFIITLSFIMSVGAMAQTYITQVKPYGQKLWGYVDQDGKAVTEAIYKKCYHFDGDGLAPIYESKQFIFINTKGEILETEIKGFKLIEGFIGFGGVQGFHDGMVAVVKGKKWGFLNLEGKIAIELKYDEVSVFNEGFAIARIGEDFYVINKIGEETLIEGDNFADIKRFSEGLAPFINNDKMGGCINTNAKVSISADFLSVGYFVGGIAWAKDANKKVGYVNKKGEWLVEPQFDATKNFDPVSGLARVKTNGLWAYTNKSGEILYVDTESWGDFSEGLSRGKKGGKTGFYNNKGEWVIAAQYEAGRDFKNGFAAVKKGGKWGFINMKGEWILEPQYAAVKDLERIN